KDMFWVKLRVVLGAGTLAVISALVATGVWQSGIHRNQSHAARQLAALPAGEQPRASVSTSDEAPGESAREAEGLKLPLLVVSAQRGQPLAGAGVMASYWQRTSENRADLNFTTDELGHCAVPVSDREFEILRIWISAPGHVPKVIDWRKYEFQAQPEEYVVRLEPGGVIGGVVKDEADRPVSQAKLRVSGVGMVSSRRENIGYRDESSSVFSDEHGYWRFDQAPTGLDTLKFFVTHPDYANAMVFLPLAPPGSTNHVVVMKRGVQVRGTVSNRFELPVFEAAVEEVDSYGGPVVSATTDLLGEFALNHVKPGPLKLKIDAKGYKSLTRTVLITTNAEAISFVLEDAPPEDKTDAAPASVKTVRLAGTVKDEETGQPLDRFKVLLDERRGTPGPDFLGEGRNGAFDWEHPVMFFNEYAL